MFASDVQVHKQGEPQDVSSAEEVSQLAGIPVRLPTRIEGDAALQVSPGGEIDFNIDMNHIQSLLSEIGRSDIKLPEGMDGARVQVGLGQRGDGDVRRVQIRFGASPPARIRP